MADFEWNKDLEKTIIQDRPIHCSKCDGKLFYVSGGKYECRACGHHDYDDFGKVKHFLGEHGPSPAPVIAAATGVKTEIINHFLKKGRLEIPEGSKYFLQCERCQCAIRYGRFCPECMRELTGGLRAAFHEDVGERPKNTPKLSGQYHFIKK
ncbi:MAG: hypothetical protein IJW37_03945 [Lachnospiraceae bacterium]|nr:hypothetical protein [Lachnospiraceae bacterium]